MFLDDEGVEGTRVRMGPNSHLDPVDTNPVPIKIPLYRQYP
jgi:hypothetical protein